MLYEYKDSYLAIDQDREDRAVADVDVYNLTDQYYLEKLIIYKAYIIACIDDIRSPDDTFSAKLKYYQIEFDKALRDAKSSQVATSTGTPASSWSTEIGRA